MIMALLMCNPGLGDVEWWMDSCASGGDSSGGDPWGLFVFIGALILMWTIDGDGGG
jgi:hypothetical protein